MKLFDLLSPVMGRCLLLVGLLAGVGMAQDGAAPVQLRTLCFQHVGNLKELHVMQDKGSGVPVRLFTSAFSDPVQVKLREGTIRFAVPAEDAAEGEPAFKVVAEGKSPGGARQLAVFFPSGNEDMPYRVSILDEGEAAFPMGSTLIFNLTPTDARFTIGERSKEIPTGKIATVGLPAKVNALNQATVRVHLKNQEGSWQAVSSTLWQATDAMRGLALAYLHPTTGRPTVHCIQETPPWRLPKLE